MAMIWSQNTITAYGTIALLSHHPVLVILSIPSHDVRARCQGDEDESDAPARTIDDADPACALARDHSQRGRTKLPDPAGEDGGPVSAWRAQRRDGAHPRAEALRGAGQPVLRREPARRRRLDRRRRGRQRRGGRTHHPGG